MKMNKIMEAANLIKNSKKTMVLTGAGISTESGVPDFRSDKTGLWTKMDPAEVLSAHIMEKYPEKFYSNGFKILTDMADVKPNAGHIAIADMEKDGFVQGVITQNIDNLHHKAGSRKIFEVHGQTRTASCTRCGREYDFSILQEKVDAGEIPPICPSCGGVLRTDVVLFGDQMPVAYSHAVRELENTELLIVVGTSLVVAPVSFLPRMVKKLIIINNEPTPYDRVADVVFNEGSGKVLQNIYEALNEK
ncbi:MAG: NAD-dependent protein deacylase [Tissierellia bacterium]|nr:NAD-dependent protein deacylase [Tissierellia bacterium]